MKILYLIITLLLLVSSCADSEMQKQLKNIEPLIMQDPKAAQLTLDSIHEAEPLALQAPTEMAQYLLLDTYCKYRTNEKIPNDSLISIAEDYFLQHGTHHEKMLSLFLHGYVLRKNKQQSESILKYKAALDEGVVCKDHFMLGQIYTGLAFLCGEIMDDDQIDFSEKALEHYMIVGREPYILDSEINIGMAKLNYNTFTEEALEILQKAKDRAIIYNDTLILAKCYKLLAEAEMKMGKFDSAYYYYQHTIQDLHSQLGCRNCDLMAYVCASLGKRDSALVYLDRAERMAKSKISISFHWNIAAHVYNQLGDSGRANTYYSRQVHDLKSNFKEKLNNTVAKEQRDYVEQKLERTKDKVLWYRIIIAVGLTLLFLLIWLYIAKKCKNKTLTERLQLLREKQLENEERIEQLECARRDAVYNIKKSEVGQKLYNASTGETVFDEQDWFFLSQLFKELLPTFSNTLLLEKSLGDTEWRICMLLKLDFKSKDISIIMNRALSTISSINNRVYKRVFDSAEGGSKEWIEYIKSL